MSKPFNIIQNDINGASKQYYISHENSKYKVNCKTIDRILNNEKLLKLKDVKAARRISESESHGPKKIKRRK